MVYFWLWVLLGIQNPELAYQNGNEAMHQIAQVFVNEPGFGGHVSGYWSRYKSEITISTTSILWYSIYPTFYRNSETYVFRKKPSSPRDDG